MTSNNYETLSNKYKTSETPFLSKEEVEAYVLARLPATQAAIERVFRELVDRGIEPHSFLDLGAGPGTGLLVAQALFPDLTEATLVERNPEMVRTGKEFLAESAVDITWIEADMAKIEPKKHDLVLMSYSLGEGNQELLKKAWEWGDILVLIEPGTPRGFKTILQAREQLLELGAYLVAPCPHGGKCPMQSSGWCHFSARLNRTREHMHMKGGSRGWEDEKFSYLILSKTLIGSSLNRIVHQPQKRKGHMNFKICTELGIMDRTVSKSSGAFFKMATKLEWGDELT